jgi:hypothetical protein
MKIVRIGALPVIIVAFVTNLRMKIERVFYFELSKVKNVTVLNLKRFERSMNYDNWCCSVTQGRIQGECGGTVAPHFDQKFSLFPIINGCFRIPHLPWKKFLIVPHPPFAPLRKSSGFATALTESKISILSSFLLFHETIWSERLLYKAVKGN